mgnify:FL=1|tara:strand:+ start:161 stop:718 length:558 start_codon:yes stop_codon:yes gene_type:complete
MTKETKQVVGKAALVLAIQDARTAIFNSTNPHFKSKFANEKSVKEATDPALKKHGCAMSHELRIDPTFHLCTHVIDALGEIVAQSHYPLKEAKPQEVASQITYGRRYNRSAIMGVCADTDDDANGATFITKDQVANLEYLIKKTQSNLKNYLRVIDAVSLEKIGIDKYDMALAKLKNKLSDMEKK